MSNSESDFIKHNQWFNSEIDVRFNQFLTSYEFRNTVRRELEEQFPHLWLQHMTDNNYWNSIVSRLNDTVDNGIWRIEYATKNEVNKLMSNGSLESLKASILGGMSSKYNQLEEQLKRENTISERKRNERLIEMEKKLQNLEKSQWHTLLGGTVLGVGLGILGCKMKT
jgi:hypothetical protein